MSFHGDRPRRATTPEFVPRNDKTTNIQTLSLAHETTKRREIVLWGQRKGQSELGCGTLNFMPWQKLTAPVPAEVRAAMKGKMRILVDESLGRGVADQLKYEGYNAVFGDDVGLKGKHDSTVAAYAWRENRMIWTHDADFLNDRVVPENSNPGVVVLPGAGGDQGAMLTGLAVAIAVFGHGEWARTKALINSAGEMTIWSRKVETGAVTSTRYRMTKGEHPEIWVDD